MSALENITPVKLKIKRLERLAGSTKVKTGKSPATQVKILRYLTSENKGGEEEKGSKVLGPSPRQINSLLKGRCPNRALLGAQMEAREKKDIKLPKIKSTPGREGRVNQGKKSGKNVGFGPLEKWLSAAKSKAEVQGRVEDDKDNINDKPMLGTHVGRMKRKLEGREEASASQREGGGKDKDPDICPNPGKEEE